jgi:hypothetical protein
MYYAKVPYKCLFYLTSYSPIHACNCAIIYSQYAAMGWCTCEPIIITTKCEKSSLLRNSMCNWARGWRTWCWVRHLCFTDDIQYFYLYKTSQLASNDWYCLVVLCRVFVVVIWSLTFLSNMGFSFLWWGFFWLIKNVIIIQNIVVVLK